MTTTFPNLDGLPREELALLAGNGKNPYSVRLLAERWFPGKPRGFVRATRDLLAYARWKALAMESRAGGNIPSALDYEAVCDSIYDRLPAWAKW